VSGWQFDSALFVEEVLKPVQDGWRPDEDLFRVYLLPLDVRDARVIAAALDEINRQFTQQRYRGFRRACELLRAKHPTAKAILTDPARRELHRGVVADRSRKLAESLRQRLQGAPGMPSAEVAGLARSSKGAITRTAIRVALTEIGATELDPVGLPSTPETSRWADVRTLLTALQHDSLWDYLASTLGGPTPAPADIAARRKALRVSRNADSVAETTILKNLEQWIEAGELVAVLRYELFSELEGRAQFNYAEVLRAAEAVSGRLPRLELPADHNAVAYAVWCMHRVSGAQQEPGWQTDYNEAIGQLQLRTALAVLKAQPGLPKEWSAVREDLTERLSALDAELVRCRSLEGQDVEAAVEGYHRVRKELADPELDTAIERCRPAEPRSATAWIREGRVVVSWQPSTSTVGRIGYRVSRGNAVVCEETGGCELVDQDVPGGTPLVYTIHTLRDGNPSAGSARTRAITVLCEVVGLEVRGEPDAISGRWRLPDGAVGAVVSRGGTTTLPDVRSTSFVDRSVQSGRSYDYLVRARYRLADGSEAFSDGVHATASCQELPLAVTDLEARFEDEELVARWTPPPQGEVEILEIRPGDEPPHPDVISVAKARRSGTVVRRIEPSGRGTLRGRITQPVSRVVLLPITVLDELAAIGSPCAVDRRQNPVQALRIERRGTHVQLTWEWPAGATDARVVWRTSVKPSGPTDPNACHEDVTRVRYDSKGVLVRVPEGEHWFGVCTVLSEGASRSFGPLVLKREATAGTAHYTVERVRWGRRRILVVEGDQGRDVPPLVLNAKAGVRPMSAEDGMRLLRADGGASPMRIEFDLPTNLRRPVHLRAFSLDQQVILVASRPDRLILN
jgi:hypothetical protein